MEFTFRTLSVATYAFAILTACGHNTQKKESQTPPKPQILEDIANFNPEDPLMASGCNGSSGSATWKLNAIGGHEGGHSATVRLLGSCSMVKVSPYHFLSAAHCFFDQEKGTIRDYYAKEGNLVRIANDGDADPRHAEELRIKKVTLHPSYSAACIGGCKGAGYLPLKKPGTVDLAILEVAEISKFEQASISYDYVPDEAPLRLEGYGCSHGMNQPSGRLIKRYSRTRSVDVGWLPKDAEEATKDPQTLQKTYILTKANLNDGSSISPGDSGGPIYLDSESSAVVVGVNAYYSFKKLQPGDAAISEVNWHTRLSGEGENGSANWLKSILKESTFDWQNASSADLCTKELELVVANGLISEEEVGLYKLLRQAPKYWGSTRNSQIAGWYDCSLVSDHLRDLWRQEVQEQNHD